MLDAAKGASAVHAQSQVARHKRAVEVVGLYLRHYPHFGSAGRFVASAWLDRYRDLPLFRILIQPADLAKAAATTREREWLFAVAMTVLRERFAGLYANLSALPEALEIACDLATSASVLTCDPILHSLLLRANAEALAVRSEAAQQRRNQSARPDNSAANGDHGNLNAAIPPAMAMHQIEHALDRAVHRTQGRRDETGAP